MSRAQPDRSADEAAAQWMLRHDRGLSAVEQDEFLRWLTADARHQAAWAEVREAWGEFDRLAGLQTSLGAIPDPDLLAPRRRLRGRSVWRWGAVVLALAAAVAVGFFLYPRAHPAAAPVPPAVDLASALEQRTLEDGSVVTLNHGADVQVTYTLTERRVRLLRGEASFAVAKNPARPFIVSAGLIDVRAVGTAFNVRLSPAAVEVLVTEGVVQVNPALPVAATATGLPVAPTLVHANQRVIVDHQTMLVPPRVASLPPTEVASRLTWLPRLLDFTDAPLDDIVAEFNRHNVVRLVLGEPGLEGLRLSATFRSDNVEGFVRLMAADFGLRAEWRGSEIVLRHAR